ncbi:MAG: MarR family winged helix-turn-helix transcriptional regulator [Patescibacteria group bacterium]
MDLKEDVGYLLQHVAFVLGRHSDQVLQEQLGIGFSQFKIMMVLEHKPQLRQRQIADMLGQTEASISRQIKLMKSLGLLQTKTNPRNRREHLTVLTNKGQRFSLNATEVLNRYHAPMFNDINGKDQQKLRELLEKLHEHSCRYTQNECLR